MTASALRDSSRNRAGDPPALHVDRVSAGYRGQGLALDDISFNVKKGERVAVIGPNGAGKSTLFKAIVGVMQISAGRITIYGEDTHSSHTNVGYVPQQSAIDWAFPASVFDVVMMGRCRHIGWFRWPGKDDRIIVRDILEHLSLDQLADRQISELSGGQRQRVFIARAMAQDTRLMVLDEPFTGVDQPAEQEIIESLDILTSHGITLLISTHHMENAALHFDKILILRQRLLAYGPPDDTLTTANMRDAFGVAMPVRMQGDDLLMFRVNYAGEATGNGSD
ncbi:MAG: metal ABC transporter ATP-binding protein [Chloroflexota bacterium]|nr:metal ABC transporter ATP-binding protein [Chloroflexota bacterium]MDE2946000.1 metal ABC transporter ATP-binding protein [Chloroflexota bacterium]